MNLTSLSIMSVVGYKVASLTALIGSLDLNAFIVVLATK
jgi:hypothetical protein